MQPLFEAVIYPTLVSALAVAMLACLWQLFRQQRAQLRAAREQAEHGRREDRRRQVEHRLWVRKRRREEREADAREERGCD